MKQSYFDTLNDALNSENLIESWNCMAPPIQYGETRSYDFDDGTKYGHHVSIYRDNRGMYERPIHYKR